MTKTNPEGHIISDLKAGAAYLDQRVTSHNQSGGITAHTVNLGPQTRHMDQSLKTQILSDLPRSKPVTVVAVMGDGEAVQFALEIHAFLKDNGFPLAEDGISQAIYSGVQKGLAFDVSASTLIIGTNIP